MRFLPLVLIAINISPLLTACTTAPPLTDRIAHAQSIAKGAGFQSTVITTPQFDLLAYRKRVRQPTDRLVIYIEGDGHAWKTASLPSDNPTPISPLALSLAVQDPRSAAYLARPCQFVTLPSRGCSVEQWTNARFSPAVITSMNTAINTLKNEFGAKQLVLVGYSGGGAVALLLAAQRQDVVQLVTVAGNLDTQAWVNLYGLEPLTGSLNPASVASSLRSMPQVHFIGGKDEVIPKAVTQSYLQKMGSPNQAKVIELPNYGHVCCWSENWKELLKRASEANP